MATKKCANGHLYDPAIYGDKCPFCPSPTGSTKVNTDFQEGLGTKVLGGDEPKPIETIGINGNDAAGDNNTVINPVGGNATGETWVGGNKRLVGLLVSYSANPNGEVYKVYEGRTTIGRDRTCDIPFPNDPHMSSQHLMIQYVGARGVFKAEDLKTSNGSNVNGKIYLMGEVFELNNNDKIILGSTLFIFLTIPN